MRISKPSERGWRILSAIDTDYRRMSVKARSAAFSTLLDIDPVRVKRMRVIHYAHSPPGSDD